MSGSGCGSPASASTASCSTASPPATTPAGSPRCAGSSRRSRCSPRRSSGSAPRRSPTATPARSPTCCGWPCRPGTPRAEKQEPPPAPPPRPARAGPGPAGPRYPAGAGASCAALAEGRAPRAVWTALPGDGLADAAGRTLCRGDAGRRAAGRWSSSPTARTSTGSTPRSPRGCCRAGSSPPARPTSARPSATGSSWPPARGAAQVVLGTRAAAFAPGPRPRPGRRLGRRRRPARRAARALPARPRRAAALRADLDGARRAGRRLVAHRRGGAARRDRLGPRARRRPAGAARGAPRVASAPAHDFELARDPAARCRPAARRSRCDAAARGAAARARCWCRCRGAGYAAALACATLPGPGPLPGLRRPAGHLRRARLGRAGAGLPLVRPGRPRLATARTATARGCGRRGGRRARTAEELGRAFPGAAGAHLRRATGVLADRAGRARRSWSPPRAPSRSPTAATRAALLLDAWAAAGPRRPARRGGGAAPLAERRRAGPARVGGGRVVVARATPAAPPCRRWSAGTRPGSPSASWPTGASCGLPAGARRMAVAHRRPRRASPTFARRAATCPHGAERARARCPSRRRPRPGGRSGSAYLLRVPRAGGRRAGRGAAAEVQGVRSARKAAPSTSASSSTRSTWR